MRARFADLHRGGTFVMPNAWDIGSARILASVGFAALATTSSGHALSLGRQDQEVTLLELLDHSRALAAATQLPLNVDSERCFADTPTGVAETVRAIAQTGAAGCSIEDYDPESDAIDPLDVAIERVAAAAYEAGRAGLTLTARAENHLHGVDDLEDTIERLRAYRRAGANVLYAPGLRSLEHIDRLIMAVEAPVNVLLMPGGPNVGQLAEVGVRRISTGGALARSAYTHLVWDAMSLRDVGAAISGGSADARRLIDQALG